MAGSVAGIWRPLGGSGLVAVDVAYRIIVRLHCVRPMFSLRGEGVNGVSDKRPFNGASLPLVLFIGGQKRAIVRTLSDAADSALAV